MGGSVRDTKNGQQIHTSTCYPQRLEPQPLYRNPLILLIGQSRVGRLLATCKHSPQGRELKYSRTHCSFASSAERRSAWLRTISECHLFTSKYVEIDESEHQYVRRILKDIYSETSYSGSNELQRQCPTSSTLKDFTQVQMVLFPLPDRFHFVLFAVHGFSTTSVLSTFNVIAISLLFANSVRAARRTCPPPFTVPPLMLTL